MVRHIELHLETDERGTPLTGFILEEGETGQMAWLSDREFGPFDGYLDVTRWLAGVTGATPAVRPR